MEFNLVLKKISEKKYKMEKIPIKEPETSTANLNQKSSTKKDLNFSEKNKNFKFPKISKQIKNKEAFKPLIMLRSTSLNKKTKLKETKIYIPKISNKKKQIILTKKKEEKNNLEDFIETALRGEKIFFQDLIKLKKTDKDIFTNILKRKFPPKSVLWQSTNYFIITTIEKTKRNEEIFKFVLKSYIKYLSQLEMKNEGFFQIKKKLILKIFAEISQKMNISFEEFMNLKFIDQKNLLIKGNRRIILYKKSFIFMKNFEHFLKNVFIQGYKKNRKKKILTAIRNIYVKLSVNNCEGNDFGIRTVILENPKLKLPWSNLELIFAKNVTLKRFF